MGDGIRRDAADPDAFVAMDAPRLTARTLTKTAPDVGTGPAAGCTNGTSINDTIWYRVLPLGDFGITSSFTITDVSFWIYRTQVSPTVTVEIGTYNGMFPAAGFGFSSGNFISPQPVPVSLPGQILADGQRIDTHLAVPIVAAANSSVAVKISSSTILLGSGGVSTRGAVSSVMCNWTPSLETMSGFIVTVTGTY
jgi:hypothetical protein